MEHDQRPDGVALELAGRHVVVAGSKIVGASATRVLLSLGAVVTVFDDGNGPEDLAREVTLSTAGASTVFGPFNPATFPSDADLVVVSPGYPPQAPLLQQAHHQQVPVWGDVELAWRLTLHAQAQGLHTPAWLCLTGTNGKTTTVRMVEAMLRASGARAVAAGNVGLPLLDVVGHGGEPGDDQQPPFDALALELSSFQLHYTDTMRPLAAALLNIAPDHLDWHGGLDQYAADKQKVFHAASVAIVNAADVVATHLLDQAREQGLLAAGARCVSFTRQQPQPGQIGVRDGMILDRAFPDEAAQVELAPVEWVQPAAPHNVENALAAAALARAYGVSAQAIAQGLRDFQPEPHRIATVATLGRVRYVDDSKATNTHAAAASVQAFPSVVWIAGGLAKGATFDDLVVRCLPHLGAVVLLGRDRQLLAQALHEHAPHVVVHQLETTAGEQAMREAVDLGSALADSLVSAGHPEVTVLLAPACASMDMFTNYHHRGQAFATAVQVLASAQGVDARDEGGEEHGV